MTDFYIDPNGAEVRPLSGIPRRQPLEERGLSPAMPADEASVLYVAKGVTWALLGMEHTRRVGAELSRWRIKQ